MQATQRTAARSLRYLRPQVLQQARRHASSGHGHTAPVNESFGTGFYITLAAIPSSYLLYLLTRSNGDQQPYFTRVLRKLATEYQETFERRNETHMIAMDQAAADRTLFLNEPNRNIRHVDLKFPEQFNQGSPWNVPAGHAYANIDALIEKYQREANERQEEKLRQVRENRVPIEQPFEPLSKVVR